MRSRELADKKRILVLEQNLRKATGDVYNITQTGSPGSGAFLTGGNSFGASAILGTNDAYDLYIERGGTSVADFSASRLRLATSYSLYLGATSSIVSSGTDIFAAQDTANSALRVVIKNSSSGASAHATFTAVNDEDRYLSIGSCSTAYSVGSDPRVAGEGFLDYASTGLGGTARGLFIFNRLNSYLRFGTSNTERVRILAGGQVVIAHTTLAGTEQLRVNGAIYSDGNITAAGTAVTATSATGAFSRVIAGSTSRTITGGSGQAYLAQTAQCQLFFDVTNQSANNKLWDINPIGTTMQFRCINDANSAAASYMSVTRSAHLPTAIIFNEDGADCDFRVESDTFTNAISVDGGTGVTTLGMALNVGTTTDADTQGEFGTGITGSGRMLFRRRATGDGYINDTEAPVQNTGRLTIYGAAAGDTIDITYYCPALANASASFGFSNVNGALEFHGECNGLGRSAVMSLQTNSSNYCNVQIRNIADTDGINLGFENISGSAGGGVISMEASAWLDFGADTHNARYMRINTTGLHLTSARTFGWTDGTVTGTLDTTLNRVSAGVVGVKNTGGAAALRIFGDSTKYFGILADSGGSVTADNSTASSSIYVGGNAIYFNPNGARACQLGNGTYRWESLNVHSFVAFGAAPATTGQIQFGTGHVIAWRDAANTADLTMLSSDASDDLVFNENGSDIDFRGEGDNKTSCLLLDASDDEVAIDGRFSLIDSTPSQITGDQNNYAGAEGTATSRSTVWRLSSDAARNITGIAGGLQGRVLKLVNVGAQNIVIQNQNASSTDVNRVITGTGADITLAADDTMDLWYDSTTQRWRVFA
jgi:hypothetical protein